MIVLEHLVVDKGYSLISKEELQNLECAQLAVKTIAKHNALGHVMIAENGGPENFFKRFPDLNFESLDKPPFLGILTSSFATCVNSNIKILEKNDVVGAKQTVEKLKEFTEAKLTKIFLDAIKASQEDKDSFLVFGHG